LITGGQGSISTAAKLLCAVPPGPGALVLSNAGTASPAYVGMGTGVTTTNGLPVPSGAVPVVIPLYPGNAGGSLYACTASGFAYVGWMVSTATGGTGTGTLG
jgi:hypothetical protein